MKRTVLFSYLKQNKSDLVCLQETHVTARDIVVWERIEVKGNLFWFQNICREVNIKLELDSTLVVSVLYSEHDLIVAIVYAPNDSREKMSFFFKNLQVLLGDFSEKTFLLCGDFNCVTRNELDIISGIPHRISEVKQFNKLFILVKKTLLGAD